MKLEMSVDKKGDRGDFKRTTGVILQSCETVLVHGEESQKMI